MPFINRCGGGGSAKLQSKTATPSTSQVVVTPDSDYDGLDKCTVSAIKLQSKSVSPSTSYKEVYPDSSYDGLSKVTVNGIELTSKTVTPSKEQQTVLPGAGYDGLGSVTVNAAPTETKKITDNGTYTPTGDNVGFGSVEVSTTMGIFGRAILNTGGSYTTSITFDLTGSNGDFNWYQNSNIELPNRDPDYIMLYMVPWTIANIGYTTTNSDGSTTNDGLIYGEFFHPNSSSTEWNFRGRTTAGYVNRSADYITVSYDKTKKEISFLISSGAGSGGSGWIDWNGNENVLSVYVVGLFWKN